MVPDPALRFATLVGRDHYVRVDTNDGVGLDEVVVAGGAEEAARHRRSWASHRTLTDPAHARARSAMRQELARPPQDTDVEVRDLADYDRALGVA